MSLRSKPYKVLGREYWLCVDCLMAAVNGDLTGVEASEGFSVEARTADIRQGLARLGEIYPHFDIDTGEGHEEFSRRGCDCCEASANLAGEFHRFVELIDTPSDYEQCSACGFDHEYELLEAQQKHASLEEGEIT